MNTNRNEVSAFYFEAYIWFYLSCVSNDYVDEAECVEVASEREVSFSFIFTSAI